MWLITAGMQGFRAFFCFQPYLDSLVVHEWVSPNELQHLDQQEMDVWMTLMEQIIFYRDTEDFLLSYRDEILKGDPGLIR